MTLLYIAIMSAMDRACGNPNDHIPRIIAAPLMGWAAAAIRGQGLHWVAVLYALGFLAARSIGLGNAVGPGLLGIKPARRKTDTNKGPQWWQFGRLLDSAWLSLLFLGAMWGMAITLPTIWLDHKSWIFVPICMVSVPVAVYLAHGSWVRQEWIRGLLIGLGACLL